MIHITEVGPRDGLQNEAQAIPTDIKVQFIDLLSQAGLREIEITAFVSPKWVPQLADADEVCRRITRHPNVTYSALVPNQLGLERALAAHIDKVCVMTAASETFNQRNINASIDESFRRLVPIVRAARAAKLKTRAYVSTAFFCPYEGVVLPDAAATVVRRCVDAGVDEVSIGDTIGKADPKQVRAVLERLDGIPTDALVLHFHDTFGRAIDNIAEGFALGVRRFDASVAGLGGCPYAPGALGNVSTQAVVAWALAQRIPCGVDCTVLEVAAALITKRET